MKLKDKICVVTGASSGMGRAIARLFAQEGAAVIAVARRKSRLDELAAENPNIHPLVADMMEQDQVVAMVKDTVAKYGRLDILVNNAGIMDDFTMLADVTDELWDKVMRVNVNAPMYAIREALPTMVQQGGGVILNISSIGGLQGCRAGTAYTTSKHALNGMTKNVAFQYAPQHIRCNAICPGGVDTEIISDSSHLHKTGMGRATAGVGANYRNGSPEEIATAALFLVSDDSSLINGALLVADAGFTAY